MAVQFWLMDGRAPRWDGATIDPYDVPDGLGLLTVSESLLEAKGDRDSGAFGDGLFIAEATFDERSWRLRLLWNER
jgi:hypothetical protein